MWDCCSVLACSQSKYVLLDHGIARIPPPPLTHPLLCYYPPITLSKCLVSLNYDLLDHLNCARMIRRYTFVCMCVHVELRERET